MRLVPKRTLFALLAVVFAVSGCERDTTVSPDPNPSPPAPSFAAAPEVAADQLTRLAGWEVDDDARSSLDLPEDLARTGGLITNFERADLGDGIAHYAFDVRFGPGPYDLIRLHRVVQERRPGFVGRVRPNIFLLHGDAKDFTGMFLPGTLSTNTPDDFGLAIYLAENGIDVWGMDQGWCFIPADETDQSVGVGWGLQRSADDLRLGVAIARISRLLTASGPARMNVLGYSSAVPTIYTAANDEAVLPARERNIGGLIPADFFPVTDDEGWIGTLSADFEFQQSLIDNGEYLSRIPFDLLADAYTTAPDADSPFAPGFTNSQFFWFFMTAQVFGPPTFHYFGAEGFGPDGFATGFAFVEESWVLDFLFAGVKFQPTQFFADYDALVGQVYDVPWDDNYALIEVPILQFDARGGANLDGTDPAAFTGSTDVTLVSVSPDPTRDVTTDFGHIDLFLAPVAEDIAWPQLLDWVLEHSPRGARGRGHGAMGTR